MADPKKLARITAQRGNAASGEKTPDAASLDSTENQESILNPESIVATVGGTEVDIYPLSFKEVRKLRALMTLIFAEASGNGPVLSRITGTLGLNDKMRNEFIRIVARATFPTNASELQLINMGNVMQEIDDKADFAELGLLMTVMATKNPFTGGANPK